MDCQEYHSLLRISAQRIILLLGLPERVESSQLQIRIGADILEKRLSFRFVFFDDHLDLHYQRITLV